MWIYKNKPFNGKIESYWGFVYKISCISTNKFYIGSKQFYSRTNVKISKKRSNELYTGVGRKKLKEKKIKESDWKTYISSSKKVQEMIKQNPDNFVFEILFLYETKAEMLLKEMVLIGTEFLKRNVLILNEWLSIKSFKLK